MSNWPYKLATELDTPERIHGTINHGPDDDQLRLGLYCEEASHAGAPWFICSFMPNYGLLEATGDLQWTVSDMYPTGTSALISLAAVRQQLLVDDKPVPVDSRGIPKTEGRARTEGRGRWTFECQTCGRRNNYKTESFQEAVASLLRAGIKEISLAGLESMVKRTSK
ncbi:hypothetical protein ACQCSX_08805 [Pseudarthrobacter sp. P1]|uniref:hypothetical protein n=1 Tax=Pseudarthrobacter sp. P1 TaxID=3418418 RepID=UPI003CE6EE3B